MLGRGNGLHRRPVTSVERTSPLIRVHSLPFPARDARRGRVARDCQPVRIACAGGIGGEVLGLAPRADCPGSNPHRHRSEPGGGDPSYRRRRFPRFVTVLPRTRPPLRRAALSRDRLGGGGALGRTRSLAGRRQGRFHRRRHHRYRAARGEDRIHRSRSSHPRAYRGAPGRPDRILRRPRGTADHHSAAVVVLAGGAACTPHSPGNRGPSRFGEHGAGATAVGRRRRAPGHGGDRCRRQRAARSRLADAARRLSAVHERRGGVGGQSARAEPARRTRSIPLDRAPRKPGNR